VRGVIGTVPEEGIPLSGGKTSLLAQTTRYKIGLRTDILPKLQIQIAAFQQDFVSELVYNPDSGQDEAGAPSRRKGIEFSAQYHPLRWLELNTDLAFSKPRYRTEDLAAFGLAGPYIADAPNFIYSAGILIDDLGPWSASLIWRRLGTHRLSDGDAYPVDRGYASSISMSATPFHMGGSCRSACSTSSTATMRRPIITTPVAWSASLRKG